MRTPEPGASPSGVPGAQGAAATPATPQECVTMVDAVEQAIKRAAGDATPDSAAVRDASAAGVHASTAANLQTWLDASGLQLPTPAANDLRGLVDAAADNTRLRRQLEALREAELELAAREAEETAASFSVLEEENQDLAANNARLQARIAELEALAEAAEAAAVAWQQQATAPQPPEQQEQATPPPTQRPASADSMAERATAVLKRAADTRRLSGMYEEEQLASFRQLETAEGALSAVKSQCPGTSRSAQAAMSARLAHAEAEVAAAAEAAREATRKLEHVLLEKDRVQEELATIKQQLEARPLAHEHHAQLYRQLADAHTQLQDEKQQHQRLTGSLLEHAGRLSHKYFNLSDDHWELQQRYRRLAQDHDQLAGQLKDAHEALYDLHAAVASTPPDKRRQQRHLLARMAEAEQAVRLLETDKRQLQERLLEAQAFIACLQQRGAPAPDGAQPGLGETPPRSAGHSSSAQFATPGPTPDAAAAAGGALVPLLPAPEASAAREQPDAAASCGSGDPQPGGFGGFATPVRGRSNPLFDLPATPGSSNAAPGGDAAPAGSVLDAAWPSNPLSPILAAAAAARSSAVSAGPREQARAQQAQWRAASHELQDVQQEQNGLRSEISKAKSALAELAGQLRASVGAPDAAARPNASWPAASDPGFVGPAGAAAGCTAATRPSHSAGSAARPGSGAGLAAAGRGGQPAGSAEFTFPCLGHSSAHAASSCSPEGSQGQEDGTEAASSRSQPAEAQPSALAGEASTAQAAEAAAAAAAAMRSAFPAAAPAGAAPQQAAVAAAMLSAFPRAAAGRPAPSGAAPSRGAASAASSGSKGSISLEQLIEDAESVSLEYGISHAGGARPGGGASVGATPGSASSSAGTAGWHARFRQLSPGPEVTPLPPAGAVVEDMQSVLRPRQPGAGPQPPSQPHATPGAAAGGTPPGATPLGLERVASNSGLHELGDCTAAGKRNSPAAPSMQEQQRAALASTPEPVLAAGTAAHSSGTPAASGASAPHSAVKKAAALLASISPAGLSASAGSPAGPAAPALLLQHLTPEWLRSLKRKCKQESEQLRELRRQLGLATPDTSPPTPAQQQQQQPQQQHEAPAAASAADACSEPAGASPSDSHISRTASAAAGGRSATIDRLRRRAMAQAAAAAAASPEPSSLPRCDGTGGDAALQPAAALQHASSSGSLADYMLQQHGSAQLAGACSSGNASRCSSTGPQAPGVLPRPGCPTPGSVFSEPGDGSPGLGSGDRGSGSPTSPDLLLAGLNSSRAAARQLQLQLLRQLECTTSLPAAGAETAGGHAPAAGLEQRGRLVGAGGSAGAGGAGSLGSPSGGRCGGRPADGHAAQPQSTGASPLTPGAALNAGAESRLLSPTTQVQLVFDEEEPGSEGADEAQRQARSSASQQLPACSEGSSCGVPLAAAAQPAEDAAVAAPSPPLSAMSVCSAAAAASSAPQRSLHAHALSSVTAGTLTASVQPGTSPAPASCARDVAPSSSGAVAAPAPPSSQSCSGADPSLDSWVSEPRAAGGTGARAASPASAAQQPQPKLPITLGDSPTGSLLVQRQLRSSASESGTAAAAAAPGSMTSSSVSSRVPAASLSLGRSPPSSPRREASGSAQSASPAAHQASGTQRGGPSGAAAAAAETFEEIALHDTRSQQQHSAGAGSWPALGARAPMVALQGRRPANSASRSAGSAGSGASPLALVADPCLEGALEAVVDFSAGSTAAGQPARRPASGGGSRSAASGSCVFATPAAAFDSPAGGSCNDSGAPQPFFTGRAGSASAGGSRASAGSLAATEAAAGAAGADGASGPATAARCQADRLRQLLATPCSSVGSPGAPPSAKQHGACSSSGGAMPASSPTLSELGFIAASGSADVARAKQLQAQQLRAQQPSGEYESMSFEQRLALLCDDKDGHSDGDEAAAVVPSRPQQGRAAPGSSSGADSGSGATQQHGTAAPGSTGSAAGALQLQARPRRRWQLPSPELPDHAVCCATQTSPEPAAVPERAGVCDVEVQFPTPAPAQQLACSASKASGTGAAPCDLRASPVKRRDQHA